MPPTVEKVNGKKRTLVWDTTLDSKLLSDYPSVENALSQNITVPNVFDKKEHLEVTYILTYDSKGSRLQMQGDAAVSGGTKSDTVSRQMKSKSFNGALVKASTLAHYGPN